MLMFSRTELPIWAYWTLCFITIYIIRALGYLVLRRRSHSHNKTAARQIVSSAVTWQFRIRVFPTEDDRAVLASAICVIVVLSSGWEHIFVTREELFTTNFALAYVFI